MAFKLANMSNAGNLTPLAVDLIAIFKSLKQTRKYANATKTVACTELSDCINKHLKTNLKVKINPSISCNANMSIPLLTKNNSMWQEIYREWFPEELGKDGDKLVKRSSNGIVLGEINADGTLGGAFSKLKGTINLSHDLVYPRQWKIAEDGAAGITLHEIGHFINYLRALTYTCRSNYILQQLNNSVLGNVPRDIKVKFMKEIASKENLDINDDIDQCAKLDNDKVIVTIFTNAAKRQMLSELGDDVYNARGFESLSDNFAAQHGCGLALVYALDSMPGMSLRKMGTAGDLIANTALLALELGTIILNPAFAAVIGAMVIACYDPAGIIYDDPKDRYRRISDALVDKLRQNRAGDNTILARDITEIQKVMSQYTNSRGQLQTLYEYFTPGGRNNLSVRELNQTLEELNANLLYVSAAKLKALAE